MSSDINGGLKEFADNLAPSQILVNEVGRIIDRLTRYLHSSRFAWRHSINRVVPLGSYAKKTSLRIMMDLDLVVYLNDCHYPFKDFLSALEEHIELSESYTNLAVTGTRLFFIAEGNLHVDLLPATNRVPRSLISQGKSAQEMQHQMTLTHIRNSSNPFDEGWKQSTALSETAVEFVKRKNEKFHCSTMARLAKFWSKTICIEGFHSGRSSIMEYIAIRATEKEQSGGRENTLRSFRRFLMEIINTKEMVIYWTQYYEEAEIQPRMKASRPLLLDPTNPYNNILRGKNTPFMLEMAKFAEVSLERLEQAECRALRGGPIDLIAMLTPQPEWAYLPFNVKKLKKPRNFTVYVRDGSGLTMPKTVTKSSMEETDREIIENFLFSFSEVAVTGSKKKGIRNVAQKVQTDVQRMIAPDASWGPGGHASSTDAKLEIPFKDENGVSKVLNVSFDMA